MGLPAKHSVAVIIRKNDHILAIRRPDDDEELPGIWGLPAGTFRDGETIHDLVRRIGEQKLGVDLSPLRKLAEGSQARRTYLLQMELWEASMQGIPNRADWKWADLDLLKPGQEAGSLCCDLAMATLGKRGRVS
jgi:ADP-ribose pyrophosphatase YjhB (NUDIX family)